MSKTKMILMAIAMVMVAGSAFAADAEQGSGVLWGPMAAAFVLGIAAFGGALGQGKATAAACEGIARNPGAAGAIRLAMILGLALIESLVIYALIIAFIVQSAR